MEEFKEIGESYANPPKPQVALVDKDTLVMYLIVRESLNMSIGKTAAQVAHASQRLQQKYQELNSEAESYIDPVYHSGWGNIPSEIIENINIFDKWMNSAVRKVVLKADEKEWVKLKELPNIVLIVDAGFTELSPNTETVIGFWPMYKAEAPKLIKKLQLLK